MGCDLLETNGYKSIFLPVSEDCDTQAKLQYFSKKDLQTLFDNACKNAINLGASKIFLYCNSLSSSIDYTSTSKKYSIPIITPLETYKNWISVILSEKNRKQIFIPKGYGHACISLEDNTQVQYKVDELYYPEYDRAIVWNDPELNIDWTIDNVILSKKDREAPFLKDSDVNF